MLLVIAAGACAQSVRKQLIKAYGQFEQDSQLRSAMASLYVIDAKTGKVIFEKNSRVGLATASTMKIITSASAYEMLGQDFRYATRFGYYGTIEDSALRGSLYIRPSGDPTFGSWRWKNTNEDSLLQRITLAVKSLGIKKYNAVVVDATGWESESIPGGWMWEDIGNYYGAGADILNWRENQYDMFLQSGSNIGDAVTIKGTKPVLYGYDFASRATSAAAGTGDNAYIYFSTSGSQGVVRGTIPVNQENFVISGAMPSGRNQFVATLADSLAGLGIHRLLMNITVDSTQGNRIDPATINTFHTEWSPPMDSMVYWFLKRSINLYGEALTKTIAARSNKAATTFNGARIIRDYWKNKNIGIEATELNIQDGSGLSPLNHVTTHAQAMILQYAKKQRWFQSYFFAFPEYNGMKMKSGTINGVKGFCGYHTSRTGVQYIFSFLVNNYNGPASKLVDKMYKVLDVLK